MEIRNTFISVLNIKEGEGKPIIFLLLISFFMGTAVAFFYTSTTSMFLAQFSTQTLPYAYIGSGIIGYLIWVASTGLGKIFSLPSMLIIYVAFLTVTVLLFFIGVEFTSITWLPFLMFIWIRVFTYVNAVVFWTLAGRIFDLRQGKRLFGLISAGEVISTIIGFFSIPFLLNYIQVPDLIMISFAGVFCCLIVLLFTLKIYSSKLLIHKTSASSAAAASSGSYVELFKSRYFKYMFLLAILPMFAIYFVDFLFLTQTKYEYPDKNFLAGFLGIFFGIAAIAEFILKVFVSGRVISRYGIRPGLAALPVLMLFSTVLAALSGSLFGAAGFFYSFIALTKFSERIIRSSVGEPTFQILYQPLPAEERLSFQNRIEGGPKAVGNIAGGVVLLIFSNLSFLNIVHYNYVFALLLVFWVKIALDMHREYRESLKKLLDNKSKKGLTSAEDESDLTEFFQELVTAKPEELALAFRIYERVNPIKAEASLMRLLMQSNTGFTPELLNVIYNNKYLSAVPVLEYCLNDEELLPVREELVQTLSNLKADKIIKFDDICRMSNDPDPLIQEKAARLFGYSSKYNAVNYLSRLIKDSSIPVSRAALISAGRLKRSELWTDIIESLGSPALSNAAASALINIGGPVLNDLEKYISRAAVNKSLLRKVMKLYGSIGGETSAAYLSKRIDYPDRDVREQVVRSLSKMGFVASAKEQQVLKEIIKSEVSIIIWMMAAVSDIKDYPGTTELEQALTTELNYKRNNLFSTLSLLYDSRTVQLVRESMSSANPNSRSYGLEIIDLMLSPDLKEILIPLFEENTIPGYLAQYQTKFPYQRLTIDKRLADIVNKEYDKVNLWIKACAIELIPEYPNAESPDILSANVAHKDPLIVESAASALNKTSPDRFERLMERLQNEDPFYQVLYVKVELTSIRNLFFVSHKIRLLKQIPLFSGLNEIILREIVNNSKELILDKDKTFTLQNGLHRYIYFLLKGALLSDEGLVISDAEMIFQFFTPVKSVKILEDSALLQIEEDKMFELMADYPELARCFLSLLNSKTILDQKDGSAILQ